MYNKIETAIILKSCTSIDEVMMVGGIFGYLKSKQKEIVPEYVNIYCHKRLRTISDENS